MSKSFFITSSGTGIGKTLITATLAHQLQAAGEQVSALKPVISGYRPGDMTSDTAELLHSVNLPVGQHNAEAISPWRFKAGLSPNVAAEREGRLLQLKELVGFCARPRGGITLIEGAGGVMAPLSYEDTMLDWMTALDVPVVLVVGTYLGSISHALTAAEALKSRGLSLQPAMPVEENARSLKAFLPYARYVVALPRVHGPRPLWQHVADLTWILT